MRNLSIRIRVTLWYTLFMIILTGSGLGLVIRLSKATIGERYKQQLIEAIEETIEDIIEDDNIDYFEDGVYIAEYDSNGILISGRFPIGLNEVMELRNEEIQQVKKEDYNFYIYDKKVSFEGKSPIWLRGILSERQSNQINRIEVEAGFIVMPLLVVISSLMGYLITRRALEPVRKIQETAQYIAENKELSMRINLSQGNDEIFRLGQTIDGMLAQLEESFQKEKQFTQDASHELRTPLAVILNESEYAIQHVEDIEEAKESIEIINRQANKMTKLVNQLLFFARAQGGNIKLQYEKIDIKEIVQYLIEENCLSYDIGIDDFVLIDQLPKSKLYEVDQNLFSRAVQNLIQNAITYGRVASRTKIEVRLFEENKYFVVEVRDEGIGICAEDLDKIWNRFYQVDRSRQESNSMGLGLSMVKWITEQHGGYVKVESVLDKGSTFYLYFPIR